MYEGVYALLGLGMMMIGVILRNVQTIQTGHKMMRFPDVTKSISPWRVREGTGLMPNEKPITMKMPGSAI